MSHYTAIIIIYNPNSTGPSKELATDMEPALRKALPQQPVELIPTNHAGHAEELAYEYAHAMRKPLVISSSGDGGYNEVVNGLIRAQLEGATPTAGLLPAGNANDHFHSVHMGDTLASIVKGAERTIDVLKLTGVYDAKPLERYAHSYIGFGLSPKIGEELNKTRLNRIKEVWIALRGILTLQHIRVRVDGKIRSYDSLVLTNVGRMAKALNLAQESKVDDGTFEVSAIYRSGTLKLFISLLRASTVGARSIKQTDRFSFQTIQPLSVQLDGEIRKLDAQTNAVVSLERSLLHCIV